MTNSDINTTLNLSCNLVRCIEDNDETAFIKTLQNSIYKSNIKGLEEQKECLTIAINCIINHVEEDTRRYHLLQMVNEEFSNIRQRITQDPA